MPQQNAPGYPPQYPQAPAYPQQGYDQYGQPGYPQNPYAAPPVSPQSSGEVPRPLTLTIAFWLAIAVPVVATVIVAITFLVTQGWMNDAINANINQNGIDPNSEEAQMASSIGNGFLMVVFAIAMIFLLVLTGLWILFAFKMRAGRNWARVTLTIFAAIWVLSGISSLVTGGNGPVNMQATADVPDNLQPPASIEALGYVQTGVGLVGMIAFLVLIYLRQTNWYFQAANHR